jgi:NAD(P)H-dependent flavin oxidoreductase YrpB (nitropropane dioxygenase family)
MADPLNTVLTERLGCRYPIVQTGMGWVATPELVAAVSEAGGFGFLSCAVLPADEVGPAIAKVKSMTSKPFGVNFHMFQPGAAQIVDTFVAERAQVRAVAFGRGPDKNMIKRFKDAGILCIPTVGAPRHAQKMVELGVDMVTVQGGEGGGHTGAISTNILLPQVLDMVKVPVLAAGGFRDGRGLAAALAYGAVGVAMGTRFLMSQESPLPEETKKRYLAAKIDDILVSTKVDGLPQRMIRNKVLDKIEKSGPIGMWIRAMEAGLQMKRQTGASFLELLAAARGMSSHGELTLAQAMMAATAPMLIQKAIVEGKPDEGLMATGVIGGVITSMPTCKEIIEQIVAEARQRLAALSGQPASPASAVA